MKALKLYAKYYKKLKALDEILKDIHPLALRELRKYPDGNVDYDGVEFHITRKVEKKFNEQLEAEMKVLRDKINEMKKQAEDKGEVILNEKETFDAYLPRSAKEGLLSAVPEYRKHFGLSEKKAV